MQLFILGIIPGHHSKDTSYLMFWSFPKKSQKYSLPPSTPRVHSDLVRWINIIDPLTMLNLTEFIPSPPKFPLLEGFY